MRGRALAAALALVLAGCAGTSAQRASMQDADAASLAAVREHKKQVKAAAKAQS